MFNLPFTPHLLVSINHIFPHLSLGTLITTTIMARATILLLLLALLLCSTSSTATRHHPTFHKITTTKHQDKGDVETAEIEEGCKGIGEEECLMRRSLVAHLDYIYTQKETP
ncbi:phytosulfokines 3-like [Cynara cardunculus var. scolymus]|uniref:Phytosulfokine n=1 Tax=Cynara cardunculus var. scolymus TaxID=59895 RepID=A0A124SHA3_CYNCS|nr:phytosulfokines 3-like [Cynara cardunculus var. scolymus]KVI08938.1 Phytosulfokine [Cynara cardunculus var. scolymus]